MPKNKFITEPILIIFDLTKPIMLETNVSDLVLRAVISQQEHDQKQHLVTFYLQKLTLSEQNYKIYDKKLLAIINFIKY